MIVIQNKASIKHLFIGLLTVLVWCGYFQAVSYGHTIYIQSSRYQVNEGKRSPFFFCYGHRIPVDDGVRAKKLKSVRVHTPDGEVRETVIRDETGLHSYMVHYDSPGTYVLAAETNPGYYTVFIDKKGRERHAIKPKSAVVDKAREIKKAYTANSTQKYTSSVKSRRRLFPDGSGCRSNWFRSET